MIDINSILSTAFEQALRPLRQEIALQQSQLRAQHEKIETLEARLQGTQEHVSLRFDVVDQRALALATRVEGTTAFVCNEEQLRDIIESHVGARIDNIKCAIDEKAQEHLEQFNHDKYDEHIEDDSLHAADEEGLKDSLQSIMRDMTIEVRSINF